MDASQARQLATRKGKAVVAARAPRKADQNLARALDHEKEILVRGNQETRFSRALTNFLKQRCVKSAGLSISDKQLFRSFRAFWMHTPERFDHPALLGQFRVELTQRGFRSDSAGKHPRWLGLALRKARIQRARKKERA